MRECSLRFEEDALSVSIPLGLPPGGPQLRAGLSLKRAGDMGRAGADPRGFGPARAAFLRAEALEGLPVYACRQVHSREVVQTGGRTPQELDGQQADGLLTDRLEALLTVTVADCLPIFLVDPVHGAIGLLHSGWQGTGIIQRGVELLQRIYGSRPAELAVTIGPGIGSCCYRVDAQRAARFSRLYGEATVRRAGGDLYLDLRAANLGILERLGVRQVTVVRNCTACVPQLSSYRRDGASFVRMVAFLGAAGRCKHPGKRDGRSGS